ncbi:MAG: nucleotidyltransferase domain-containing protein [bacterium]
MQDNSFGIENKYLNQIINLFEQYEEIELVKIFGSRANNTFSHSSDIDLIICGANVTNTLILNLKYTLEEIIPIPYYFDILNENNINDFINNSINNNHKVLYKK